MRIAVIGTGGVGGAFGAALARAGGDVTFIARGAHLAAMRAHGLRVEGDRGNTLIHPVRATDDPSEAGVADLVLFCVKLWDVEQAGAAIRPLVGPGTAVIPLQNGIDSPDRLAPILGQAALMGGTVGISATIAEPGLIRQTGTGMTMRFGEFDGTVSARAERFLALASQGGFDVAIAPDIRVAIWTKFILLTAMSGITALTRLPVGQLRDDPDLIALFEAVMREAEAVGHAEGVRLPDDVVADRIAAVRAQAPGVLASMAHDLLRGGRLELPWLAGKVVALGQRHAIPTPVNATILAALKPYANGRPV